LNSANTRADEPEDEPGCPSPEVDAPITEETFARRRSALARLSHLLVPPSDDTEQDS
jgi:hypothetical protein